MKRSTQIRLGLAILAGVLFYWFAPPSHAATVPKHVHCPTVLRCRHDARWNHTVAVENAQRIAIAYGRSSHLKPTPACHTVGGCHIVVLGQVRSRVWAQNGWHRVMFDQSPLGFQRIIRYQFTTRCGASTVATAFRVAHGENEFVINASPSPTGDYGGWQINYSAHHDAFGDGSDKAFFYVALSAWRSTEIAVRWSSCGSNWSPTWSAATNQGIA